MSRTRLHGWLAIVAAGLAAEGCQPQPAVVVSKMYSPPYAAVVVVPLLLVDGKTVSRGKAVIVEYNDALFEAQVKTQSWIGAVSVWKVFFRSREEFDAINTGETRPVRDLPRQYIPYYVQRIATKDAIKFLPPPDHPEQLGGPPISIPYVQNSAWADRYIPEGMVLERIRVEKNLPPITYTFVLRLFIPANDSSYFWFRQSHPSVFLANWFAHCPVPEPVFAQARVGDWYVQSSSPAQTQAVRAQSDALDRYPVGSAVPIPIKEARALLGLPDFTGGRPD